MSDAKTHAWAGRFSARPDTALDAINKSIGFDIRLWREDIAGSKAHAAMLEKIGLLSAEERAAIHEGLDRVGAEIEAGTFEVSDVDEDIHMAVERRLTELVGEPGKKLHTGRSRNDQVATDVRLFVRFACDQVIDGLAAVIERLGGLATRHAEDPLPAYTHLQRGMPTTLGHHLLAYAEMFLRDIDRFSDTRRRANVSPLGSGACVGSSFELDRAMTAEALGFVGYSANSLDGVSDRDFVLDFVYSATVAMTHMSRLGEELVIWSTQEFAFATLGDAITTGSSMMPNKKNPDGAELMRGKAGRVIGDLVGLLATLKGLPLTYNKDMQEDKEPLFDAFDTLMLALNMAAVTLDDVTFHTDRMRAACSGWVNATDLCELLVRAGEPLRTAHHQTGRLVALAVEEGLELEKLPIESVQAVAPLATSAMLEDLALDTLLASKSLPGGTAPARVREAALQLDARLAMIRGA